jgi:hypothetical protein
VPRSPRVFISYAHEQDLDGHRQRALDLAQSLRTRGIRAEIDQYYEHKSIYWPRWMIDEVRQAEYVLCLASPGYKQRVEAKGDRAVGRGARWEGAIITEQLYESVGAHENKFIAVVMEGCYAADIPDVLQPLGRTHYRLPRDDEALYRLLTDQPQVLPLPLGSLVVFP